MLRASALLFLATSVLGCNRNRDLRGKWSESPDGATYLAIDQRNGPGCRDLRVDQQPWPYEIGNPGPVEPGRHFIDCGMDGYGIGVDVIEGTTYRFSYWGP